MPIKKYMLSLSLLIAGQSAMGISMPSKATVASKLPNWQQTKQFVTSLPENKKARIAFYAIESALGTVYAAIGTNFTLNQGSQIIWHWKRKINAPIQLYKNTFFAASATTCTFYNMFHGYHGLWKELDIKKKIKAKLASMHDWLDENEGSHKKAN